MIGHLLKIRQLATNKGIQSVMHLQKRFRISYRSGAVKNMPEISSKRSSINYIPPILI